MDMNTTEKTKEDFKTLAALARANRFPVPGAETRVIRGRKYVRKCDTEIRYTADEWVRQGRAVRHGAEPDENGRWNEAQTDLAASRAEWARRGRKPRPGAAPAGQCSGRVGGHYAEWDMWSESDTVEKLKRASTPPKRLDDVLACIFAINRAAKRRRDAAAKFYAAHMHGFAGRSKMEKDNAYKLKDRGLLYAIESGLLQFDGVHGGLGLWAGNGYRFHARLVPVGTAVDTSQQGTFVAEAKPKTARELRLLDAAETLRALPVRSPTDLGLEEIHLVKRDRINYERLDEDLEDEDGGAA